jgi:AraC-like DNA-binding protein
VALFSALLQSIRVRKSIYFRPTFGAPWSSRLDGATTHFHFVVTGACWLQVPGSSEATRLTTGDLIVVPRGRQHVLCDPLGTRPRDFSELVNKRGGDQSGALQAGGAGPVTSFLSGRLQLENSTANMLLAALSPVIHVRAHAGRAPRWLQATATHLVDELQSGKAFRETVVSRLADVLVVQAVRAYLDESEDRNGTGLLAALYDRRVGQALALMHSQPDERWTVASLAGRLAISRSSFAERFARLLGETPHRYLTRLRLNIASERLHTTDDKISLIAAAAAYKSLPAFSKAFKQEWGVSPIEHRRIRQLGRSDRSDREPDMRARRSECRQPALFPCKE